MHRTRSVWLLLLIAACGGSDSDGELDQSSTIAAAGAPALPRPLAIPAQPIAAASPGGYLPASWDVLPTGQLAYSIPLDVPAGRAGMQPALSLHYTSGSRNGLTGVGWMLAGLPVITRCGKTLSTEGVVSGVSFTDYTTDPHPDRFCLDDQKLMVVSGAYGADQTVYRTENDAYAEITSTVSAVNAQLGPDRFTVRAKTGRVLVFDKVVAERDQWVTMPFGDGFASGGIVQGTFPVMWVLTVERDRSGNEIHYSYAPFQTNNGLGGHPSIEYLPLDIQYTFSTQAGAIGQTQGFRHVHFNYEARPASDRELGWKSGVATRLTQRIHSIEMQAPNPSQVTTAWRYDFTYETSPASGRSLLHSVRRCGYLGGCEWAKVFNWNKPAAPAFAPYTVPGVHPVDVFQTNGIPLLSDLNYWVPPSTQVFDADGDGLDDVVYYPGDTGTALGATAQMIQGSRTAAGPQMLATTYSAENASSSFNSHYTANLRPVDVDGDGTTELWFSGYGTIKYCTQKALHWTQTPTGPLFTDLPIGITEPCDIELANEEPHDAQVEFVDLDGDSRLDLVMEKADYVQGQLPTTSSLRVFFNEGGSYGLGHPTGIAPDTLRVADLYGRGKGDALIAGKDIHTDDAGVLWHTDLPAGAAPTPGPGVHFGDWNGDGLEDAMIYNPATTASGHILWNTGDGFMASPTAINFPHDLGWTYSGAQHDFADSGVHVQDMNGDGRADLVIFHKLPSAAVTLMLSDGQGNFSQVDLAVDPGYQDPKGGWGSSRIGDFDGDGRPDLLTMSNNQMIVQRQLETFPDLMATVTDEPTLWPREQITYSNEWSDHPQDKVNQTCTYPQSCTHVGMTVVRSVTSRAHLVDPVMVQVPRTVYYSYDQPVADVRGRGFLGFSTFRSWEPSRPIETITTYDLATRVTQSAPYGSASLYPNAGRPLTTTTVVPLLSPQQIAAQQSFATARISRSVHTYVVDYTTYSGTFAVHPWTTHDTEWEQSVGIDWSPVPTTTGAHVTGISEPSQSPIQVDTTEYFDPLGNMTASSRVTRGGIAETRVVTFDNRIADWLISLPVHVMVSRAEPDPNVPVVTRTSDYAYDALGRLTTVTREAIDPNPDHRETTTLTYDLFGMPHDLTFASGLLPARTAHFEYTPLVAGVPDEHIQRSQVWNDHAAAAYRPSTWIAFHPAYGVVLAAMDVNGVQGSTQYDDLGRPIVVQRDGAPAQTISYAGRADMAGGLNGLVTTVHEQMSTAVTKTDALGRTLSSAATGFDGAQLESRTSYDAFGRVAMRVEPTTAGALHPTTTYSYDGLDRPLRVGLADGHELTYSHSMFEDHAWDANHDESWLVRDVDGRTIESVNQLDLPVPAKVSTAFTYAPFDLPATVTDDQQHVTHMTYDVRGRRISLDEPDRGTTQFEYDGFGELRKQTHVGTGETRTFVYDDLGRRIETDDHDGVTQYIWDTAANGIGKLAAAISPDHFSTRTRYDAYGRTAGIDLVDDLGASYSMDATYNPQGRLATLAYPAVGTSRFTLQYTYNGFGYLQQIGEATPGKPYAPLWTVKQRDERMHLVDGQFGNNVELKQAFEPLTGRTSSIEAALPMMSDVVNLSYQYMPNGLTKLRHDSIGARNETFNYDSMMRLLNWSSASTWTSASTDYVYDTLGDLVQVNKNNQSQELFTYGTNGAQPHTVTAWQSGATIVPYTYDAMGRQITGAGRAITYSASDLPRTITAGSRQWTMAYDAFGKRVRKIGVEGTTLYLGGLYERRSTSRTASHVFHVLAEDGEVAQISWSATATPIATDYLVTDAQGSLTARLDASGQVAERFYYEPFGKRLNPDGTPFTGTVGAVKEGFTGQEHDDTMGLVNFKGRIYDPVLRHFMTPDPMVSRATFGQAWNPYSYALNSPLDFVDPSGYVTCVEKINPAGTGTNEIIECDNNGGSAGGGEGGANWPAPSSASGNGGSGPGPIGLPDGDGGIGGGGGDGGALKSDDSGSRGSTAPGRTRSDRPSKTDIGWFDDSDELGRKMGPSVDFTVRAVGPAMPGTDTPMIGTVGLHGGHVKGLAGHGNRWNATGMTRIPPGTYLLVPRDDHKIFTETGLLMEAGDFKGLAQQREAEKGKLHKWQDIDGMTLYLPGAMVPDYLLRNPAYYGHGFHTLPSSHTAPLGSYGEHLSELLKPNMGIVVWGACTQNLDVSDDDRD